jgi:hypothetical protein
MEKVTRRWYFEIIRSHPMLMNHWNSILAKNPPL